MHINLPTCIWTNLVSYFWPRNSFQSQSDTNPMPGNLAALTMATMLQCPQMFKDPMPAQLVISKMFNNTDSILNPTDCTPIQVCDPWIVGLISCLSSAVAGVVVFFVTRSYLRLRICCKGQGKEKERKEGNNKQIYRCPGVQVTIEHLHSTSLHSTSSLQSFHSATSSLC